MVCNRCISAVKQELEKLKLPVTNIALGEVQLAKKPTEKQLTSLKQNLAARGFVEPAKTLQMATFIYKYVAV